MDMDGERENVGVGDQTMSNCLQCSSKFKQKFNLTKHIKSIHNPEKFKCDGCASLFGRMEHLKRHKQMKHTLQKCEECEFSTYKNREFTNHMLGMHPPDNCNEKNR